MLYFNKNLKRHNRLCLLKKKEYKHTCLIFLLSYELIRRRPSVIRKPVLKKLNDKIN